MSLPGPGLRLVIAFCIAMIALTSAAFAACTDFTDLTQDRLAPATIAEVQLGLRTTYRDTSPALDDGRLGRITRDRLRMLCIDVPRPDGLDDVRSTLQLTVEYARLEQAFPGWATALFDIDLPKGDSPQTLGLRLAATTPMTTLALGRRALIYDCADPGGALRQFPAGARALATLTRIFKDKTEAGICEMLPVAGGIDAWQQAMERLGQINDSRIAALEILHSGGFMAWVAKDDTEKRLRRLVGTLPAVLTLIDAYNAQNGTGGPLYRGGPCSPRPAEETLTYYVLTPDDIAAMDFLVSLSPKLDAFRTESPGYDTPQALWRDLRPVLAEDLGDCILDEIETLVTGPDQLPLSFSLKPSTPENLMGDPQFAAALPVLSEMVQARAPTKAELVNRIKSALLAVQQGLALAEVTAAADTLAAASEPVPPLTDTALVEIEEDGEADPTPRITVTDATDQAVKSAIDNPELAATLQDTPIGDVTVPELMRAQVRTALEGTAARQTASTVDAQILRIEPAVVSQWTLTEPLQEAILALPYVQAAVSDASAKGLSDRLLPLAGAAYPSYRLFDEALETISGEDGQVPFSQFVTESILLKAQKTIEDPQITRVFGPLQIEDCNCVPSRKNENLHVYGFYPFWLAPTPPPRQPTADTAADDPGPPPQMQTLVDFSIIDQIAFYGLEFSARHGERVVLHNREQWRAAKRQFVNSAHQFRAQADLAFDLRDWMQWDATTIDDVVEDITTEMAPFERVESFELRHIRAALPTLFDPVQPDGVTLIFHDYEGTGLGDTEMKTLIRIVKKVYEALPNRDRLRINVAFDFPLVGDAFDKPIFDELYELLVPSPYVLAEAAAGTASGPADLDRETAKIINKILLFLERPTTDAKKGLRYRMEQGLFQGETRADVLRSIIPVVPPGGHERIKTSLRPNAIDRTPPKAFSQLDDDVIYFKDNFSGIGFWPVLDPAAPETVEINNIINRLFNAPTLPPVLAGFAAPVTQVCNYACPNRAKIALAAMALFAIVLLLTWRSFYSGIVDQIAFRFMLIGVVWISNLVLVATLFVLATCDPHAYWPGKLMGALIVVLGILLIYNFVQRIKNGPMP